MSGALKAMLVSMMFGNLASYLFFPMMPLYLREMNVDISKLGLFFSIAMIVPLVMQIYGGWIGDRVNKLFSIIIGTGFGIVGWALMLLAGNWIVLLLGFSIGSISSAFVAPSFDAMIATNSTEESRGRVYGLIQTMIGIVIFIGPLLSGFLVKNLGWRILLNIAGCVFLLAAIIRLVLFTVSRKGSLTEAEMSPDADQGFIKSGASLVKMILAGGIVFWIFLSDGIRDIGVGMTDSLLPVYLEEVLSFDILSIGILTSVLGLTGVFASIPGGALSDRLGEGVTIALGYILVAASYFALMIGKTFVFSILAFILIGLANGLLGPAIQSLISKNVPEERMGITFGLLSTSNGLVALPFPLIGGLLWKLVFPEMPFILAIMLFLSMVPLVLIKLQPGKA